MHACGRKGGAQIWGTASDEEKGKGASRGGFAMSEEAKWGVWLTFPDRPELDGWMKDPILGSGESREHWRRVELASRCCAETAAKLGHLSYGCTFEARQIDDK